MKIANPTSLWDLSPSFTISSHTTTDRQYHLATIWIQTTFCEHYLTLARSSCKWKSTTALFHSFLLLFLYFLCRWPWCHGGEVWSNALEHVSKVRSLAAPSSLLGCVDCWPWVSLLMVGVWAFLWSWFENHWRIGRNHFCGCVAGSVCVAWRTFGYCFWVKWLIQWSCVVHRHYRYHHSVFKAKKSMIWSSWPDRGQGSFESSSRPLIACPASFATLSLTPI